MAADFDPNLSTLKDKARLRLGDVGPAFILQDETYEATLASASYNEALAQLAEAIGNVYLANEGSVKLGDQRIDFKGRAEKYFQMAERLRNEYDPTNSSSAAQSERMEDSCYWPM